MKSRIGKHILSGLLILTIAWTTGCGGGSSSTGSAAETFTPNPEIFTKTPDAAAILEQDTGSGKILKLPLNIILFMFDDTVDKNGAGTIIKDLGGTLVGQIPDLGIYQGEFADLATLTALDTKIDAIELQHIAGLLAVTYDAYPDPFYDTEERDAGGTEASLTRENKPAMEKCSIMDDNMWLELEQRCPLENPEYYNLSVIMEELSKYITLNKVRVGVMDTGVNQKYGEFDDITIMNTDSPGTVAVDTDPKMHGTKVAGIIAADNDGQGINGIASKVLGKKLVIGVSTTNKTTSGQIAALTQMAKNGYTVINMSYGYEKSKFNSSRYSSLRAMYKAGLAKLDKTLFVAAAANEKFELTRDNDFPAGLDIPNLITVGGISRCKIDEAYQYSSYGPLIDIAASAVMIPCISYKGLPKIAGSSGNSFSAPQVAAVAAILKSIKPELTPSEVKSYLIDNAMGTASTVGNWRLIYTKPVFQLLVDTNVNYNVLDLLDRYGNDDPAEKAEADLSGIIVNRICGGIEYKVSTSSGADWDETYKIEGDETENPGALITDEYGNATWMLGSMENEELPILMINCLGCGFKIFGETYTVAESGTMVTFQPENALTGAPTSGSVIMDNCQVLQRYGFGDFGAGIIPGSEGLGDDPALIEIEGRFSASMPIFTDSGVEKSLSIHGSFVTPMAISLAGNNEVLNAYIEENCICARGETTK